MEPPIPFELEFLADKRMYSFLPYRKFILIRFLRNHFANGYLVDEKLDSMFAL